MLRTLADNAVKYTPRGSRVSLRAQVCGDETRIEVADDGPGIAAEDLPHIFERYYRGHAAGGHAGTGLGLPLARHLVTQMGGTLDVASLAGQGSTFIIRVAAACAMAPEDARSSAPA